MRKPIVVALANYFLPGLGYLLLGKRVVFGDVLFVAVVVQIVQLCIDPLPPYFIVYGSNALSLSLGILALFLVQLAFACDAYQLAKTEASSAA